MVARSWCLSNAKVVLLIDGLRTCLGSNPTLIILAEIVWFIRRCVLSVDTTLTPWFSFNIKCILYGQNDFRNTVFLF